MGEKRSYVRYAIDGCISLKTEDGTSSSFKVEVADISFLGATVYSKERVDVNDKIVQFELISESWKESLAGKAKIRYINEEKKDKATVFRMGLEFIDVNREILLHFLNIAQEMASSRIKKSYRAQKRDCTDYY